MFYVLDLRNLKKLLGFIVILALLFALFMIVFNSYFPLKYAGLIEKYSAEYELDPAFVCAVINVESRFDAEAVSHKDAKGLMQITKATGDWLAKGMNIEDYDYSRIFEPDINIRIGCYYLSKLLNQYDGDETLTLAAYNAGEGNVKRWLKTPEYSTDGKSLNRIPFNETRKHIDKVNLNERVYKILLRINDTFKK